MLSGAVVRSLPEPACEVRPAVVVCAIQTPLGEVIAGATDAGVCMVEFAGRAGVDGRLAALGGRLKAVGGRLQGRVKAAKPSGCGAKGSLASRWLEQIEGELRGYFAGESGGFEVPVVMVGTEFQRRVWAALRALSWGGTRSYAALARDIGRPSAVRAVARANACNPLALVVPCHRITGADGALAGYAGGVWRKAWLLRHEGAAGYGQPATLF